MKDQVGEVPFGGRKVSALGQLACRENEVDGSMDGWMNK